MSEDKTIKVCSNHSDYVVPLIWTFAFPRKEYWCPYCGYTSGMFGAGENVASSQELEERLKHYTEKTREFRSAASMVVGGGRRKKDDGSLYSLIDMDIKDREKLINIYENGWKKEQKA